MAVVVIVMQKRPGLGLHLEGEIGALRRHGG